MGCIDDNGFRPILCSVWGPSEKNEVNNLFSISLQIARARQDQWGKRRSRCVLRSPPNFKVPLGRCFPLSVGELGVSV